MAVEQAAAQEVFDGVLLSDGSIHHNGNDYFDIQLSGEGHLDWLNYIKCSLQSVGLTVPDDHPKVYDAVSRGKAYKRAVLRSFSSPLMNLQYHRWYLNGKKIVPDDLTLTPVTLAHWFMGDGSSDRPKKHASSVRVRLCSQGFSDYDVRRLINLLLRKGVLAHTERRGSGLVIVATNIDSVSVLMQMVEPYMLPSFSYKIKKPWKTIKYPARRTTGFSSLRKELRR